MPCSYLKPFINYVIDDAELRYVGAANEGDAIAVAAGAELAGRRGVVMFQNSGFGNTVNPLTSLTHTFRIPVLIIVTLRGEPGGPADEPQHELMGRITSDLLDLLGIPWDWFPTEEDAIEPVLERAVCDDGCRAPPVCADHAQGQCRAARVAVRAGSTSARTPGHRCRATFGAPHRHAARGPGEHRSGCDRNRIDRLYGS